ncbi:hypothetical protein SAMN05216383_11324 [Prevotella sp. KH2C16]|nr:hypothetical protein SAMN05216383_11324 [Prevotella sp. KH2C16]
MKSLIKILSVMACVVLFNACDSNNEEGEDNTAIFGDSFQIAFYSPSGTNIIDSLQLVKDVNSKVFRISEDILTASLTRESDGTTTGPEGSPTQNHSESHLWLPSSMTFINGSAWQKDSPFKEGLDVVPEIKTILGERGSFLSIQFGDMNYSSSYGSKNKEQDEGYAFKLVSKTLFGDENTHIFKLYYHIEGALGEFYKCEFDGKDMEIQSDRLYSLTKEYNSKAYPISRKVAAINYILKVNVER